MHSVFPLLLTAAVLASADSLTLALPSEPGPLDPPSSSAATRGLHRAELTLDQTIARALEDSFRIPDLTVSIGSRRFEETGLSAWFAGISLPIPIFDRNLGSRQAAECDLERLIGRPLDPHADAPTLSHYTTRGGRR